MTPQGGRGDDEDRFGIRAQAFHSALESNGGVARMGMIVPTRRDVRTLPFGRLSVILDMWMYEGPVELIPSNDQIKEVIYELCRRSDKHEKEIVDLINECEKYLASTHSN